ncbi:MAG TPA: (d)CMP kinase [Kofleriaceae bacterium]|nr:(d)CMP kinase [Kofleriaceae bacterium]
MRRIVVAIDGPAGAGKSSVTKQLARRLGYSLLDTGALYRSVALAAQRRGVGWDDEAGLAAIAAAMKVAFRFEGEVNHVEVDGEDVTDAIRSPEISSGASQVSALPGVRAALLELQQRIGRDGGVVAEGRDVGTVVFPRAEAKVFLTASPEERAQRRCDELRAAGQEADYTSTLEDIRIRDDRDSNRPIAPLKQADDALLVDSSTMSLDEVVDTIARHVAEAAGA